MKFGIENYWRMMSARGIKLPICYFLEAHLFDLIHKTDTHVRIQKEHYEHQPENFDHGVLYMCSWTREIIGAFKFVKSLLGENIQDYSFLDIGCGKGKVVLVWQGQCRSVGLAQAIYGIDYHEPFIKIARKNHLTMFGAEGNFFAADATTTEFSQYGKKLIVYLYNPFDDFVMQKMLNRLSALPTIIIYNNPVLSDLVLDCGYKIIHQRKGFHANAHTIIYTNHSC